MAFHCEKCGTTLSGEYETCPVCAKIEEMMKRIDAGETDVLKNWSSSVAETAAEELPEAPEAAPQAEEPGEEGLFEEILDESYPGPVIETEVLSEETVPEDEIGALEEELQEEIPQEPELPEEPVFEAEPEEAPEAEEWAPDNWSPEKIGEEEDFFPESLPEEAADSDGLPEEGAEPTGFAELTAADPNVIPVSYRTLADITIPASLKETQPEDEAEGPGAEETPEFKFPEKKLGILEQQLADKAAKAGLKPKKKKGGLLFALLIILLTMALAVVTAKFIVSPLLERKAKEAAAQPYFDYIEGTWLSEYFAYKDRPSEACVELLTVNEDGTFTMKVFLPDLEHENGWKDDKWEIASEITGTVRIIAESQTLMLEYESDGVSYYIERVFVSMGEEEMYLREYYDDTHTSYYDVLFEKVPDPAQAS